MRKRYRALTASIGLPHRLEAGNRIIKVLIVFLLGLLACACIFICFLKCMVPGKDLHKSKETLVVHQKTREEARLYKEQKEKELEWTSNDVSYLELKVRDDMDLGKEGEVIISVKRQEKDPVPMPRREDRESAFREGEGNGEAPLGVN